MRSHRSACRLLSVLLIKDDPLVQGGLDEAALGHPFQLIRSVDQQIHVPSAYSRGHVTQDPLVPVEEALDSILDDNEIQVAPPRLVTPGERPEGYSSKDPVFAENRAKLGGQLFEEF